ncbi:MAG: hypothetical protein GXY52_11335 [Chloroflexi bacterium]|nr:hypothetical protein [Chloroflexota bacterium]
MVEKKYRALRVIAGFFKVLAWIALILGILSAIGILLAGVLGSSLTALVPEMQDSMPAGGGILVGLAGFLGMLVASVVQFILLKAVSDFADLFVSLEYHSRLSAYYLSGGTNAPVGGTLAPPPGL